MTAELNPNEFIVRIEFATESVLSKGSTAAKFQIINPHTQGYDTVAFQLLRHILDALPNGATYKNRLTEPLPDNRCYIRIIKPDADGHTVFLCDWIPFNPINYNKKDMPAQGFLGTAHVIDGPHKGIGFNVWQQNDQEFVYYQIV